MELSKPAAIIFDWDNTLVNTWPTIHEALNKTFVEMGKEEWSLATTKQRVARSMRDSFPLIFGDNWEKAGEIYQQNFRAIHLQKLEALPDAEPVLQFLAESQVFVAVASNKKGDNLRKEISHIGWNKYFSNIVGASDTANDKPAPDPVYKALEGSSITASKQVWFIGDSAVDMECAYASGCLPVWYGEEPEGLKYQFSQIVANHLELLELLKCHIKK